ncbi:MAG: M20 family metallopeptidase [Pyrinomonadaceae bacterium]
MPLTELLKHFKARESETIELATQLIEIESPSRDFEGSVAAADWIASRVNEILPNAEVKFIDAEGYGRHLLIEAFTECPGKPILFLGHSDTVHPAGSKLRNPTRVEGERFYGCGGFDMKVNIAVILEVFFAIKEYGLEPARPIKLLISCDEEIGSTTGREHVETAAAESEFCLVLEPSANGRVKTGRKGTGEFHIKCEGIPSHAGLDPKRGASAILEIAKQIVKLQSFSNFETGTTVNVGTVHGGTTTNVVPAEAECAVDIRFETIAEAERLEQEIRSLTPFDERVKLEITGDINRPPLERTKEVIALFERAKAYAAEIGFNLEDAQVGGASDGNFVAALGIPVLDGLGVKGDGAHTLDEYVIVSDIPYRAVLLAKFIIEG